MSDQSSAKGALLLILLLGAAVAMVFLVLWALNYSRV